VRPGAALALAFAEQTIFDGRVSAVGLDAGQHQAPVFTLAAEDPLLRARQARRTRVYAEMSLADVLGQLASSLGLQLECEGLTDSRRVWAQFNESDLAFARRLLAAQDATLLVQGGRCWAGPRAQVPGGDIELTLGQQLRAVQVQADLAQQCTEVTVAGFDPVQGSAFQVRSQGSQPGAGSGERGDALLASASGSRSEHLAGQAVFTQGEAQALADAAFDQRLRRFVTARGTAEGLPLLRAGSRLRLAGLGAWFDNRYQVVEVWHRFDLAQGYRTEFVAHSAFIGG
jgi:phage protein D